MDKSLLVDAIIGKNFNSTRTAMAYEKIGLARSTGNQWNESWEWNKTELEKLNIGELERIYYDS